MTDQTIYVVSPMAPSAQMPFFGVFVRVTSDALRANGWTVDESTVVAAASLSRPAKLYRHIVLGLRIVRLALKRPRLVYVHSPAWFSILLLWLLPRKSILITNIHGSEIHGRNSTANVFWPFTQRLVRKSDLVISPSRSFIETIVKATGVDPSRCHASPSGGFDAQKFFYTAKRGATPTIGYVSRITEKKGWRLFLAIYDSLKIRYPELRAIIIGDGPERTLLEAELVKRGDADLSYLGAQPQSALQAHYASMSAFIFTSEIAGIDTLGLVSIEAQACGTPVIATEAAITREYVTPEVNGFLAPKGDVEAFATAIEKVFRWTDSRRAQIAAAAAHFETIAVGADLGAAIQQAAASRVR